MTKPTSDSMTPSDIPNPNNSAHPTSLEAQAEKSDRRFLSWDRDEFITLIDKLSNRNEALKAEVEELRVSEKRANEYAEKADRLLMASASDREKQLMLEINQANVKKSMDEVFQSMEGPLGEELKAAFEEQTRLEKQIEQLTAEKQDLRNQLDSALDALRTCKYYVYDGQPHYQFDVEKVEKAFKPQP